MILTFDIFKDALNKKLFEDSFRDLLKKIADNPDRYIGLFRPSKPRTKLIQNITQSHEIKFGDGLEELFTMYFSSLGFVLYDKTLKARNGEELNIDQLFSVGNTLYLIEQKVRDDHDSTKKRGQFDNFEAKYLEAIDQFPDFNVVPIMWFIDDSLTKNQKYYLERMGKMNSRFGCNSRLYYGEEMFNHHEDGIADFPAEMWEETLSYLSLWKENLPDMPEVNFDINPRQSFDEIKNLRPTVFINLFDNEEILNQIFPIIFPQGYTLSLLKDYFNSLNGTAYKSLIADIDKYLATIKK